GYWHLNHQPGRVVLGTYFLDDGGAERKLGRKNQERAIMEMNWSTFLPLSLLGEGHGERGAKLSAKKLFRLTLCLSPGQGGLKKWAFGQALAPNPLPKGEGVQDKSLKHENWFVFAFAFSPAW